jgi:hypothetical protein
MYETVCKSLSTTRPGSSPSLPTLPAEGRPRYTSYSCADLISFFAKKMMLNRFLDQMDLAKHFKFPVVLQDQSHPEAPPSDGGDGDGDVMSSGAENDDKDSEEERKEWLGATVEFLVSGQPFQVYKQRLREWLHPPFLAHASKQNGILQEPVFALSLPLLVDKILRNLPLPVREPRVCAGKVRVYWTPVRCIAESI